MALPSIFKPAPSPFQPPSNYGKSIPNPSGKGGIEVSPTGKVTPVTYGGGGGVGTSQPVSTPATIQEAVKTPEVISKFTPSPTQSQLLGGNAFNPNQTISNIEKARENLNKNYFVDERGRLVNSSGDRIVNPNMIADYEGQVKNINKQIDRLNDYYNQPSQTQPVQSKFTQNIEGDYSQYFPQGGRSVPQRVTSGGQSYSTPQVVPIKQDLAFVRGFVSAPVTLVGKIGERIKSGGTSLLKDIGYKAVEQEVPNREIPLRQTYVEGRGIESGGTLMKPSPDLPSSDSLGQLVSTPQRYTGKVSLFTPEQISGGVATAVELGSYSIPVVGTGLLASSFGRGTLTAIDTSKPVGERLMGGAEALLSGGLLVAPKIIKLATPKYTVERIGRFIEPSEMVIFKTGERVDELGRNIVDVKGYLKGFQKEESLFGTKTEPVQIGEFAKVTKQPSKLGEMFGFKPKVIYEGTPYGAGRKSYEKVLDIFKSGMSESQARNILRKSGDIIPQTNLEGRWLVDGDKATFSGTALISPAKGSRSFKLEAKSVEGTYQSQDVFGLEGSKGLETSGRVQVAPKSRFTKTLETQKASISKIIGEKTTFFKANKFVDLGISGEESQVRSLQFSKEGKAEKFIETRFRDLTKGSKSDYTILDKAPKSPSLKTIQTTEQAVKTLPELPKPKMFPSKPIPNKVNAMDTESVYHFTSNKNLAGIREKGLLPSKGTGIHGVVGTSDRVFTTLSKQQAEKYAIMGKEGKILEIKVPKEKLYQAIREDARLRTSVGNIGQVTFKKIPKEWIKIEVPTPEVNLQSEYFGKGTYERTSGGILNIKYTNLPASFLTPKVSNVVVTKTDSQLINKEIYKQIPTLDLGSRTIQRPEEIVKQSEKIDTALKLVPKEQYKQIPRQTTPTNIKFPFPIPTIPPPIRVPIKPRFPKPKASIPSNLGGRIKNKRKEVFTALIRRKGKFQTIGSFESPTKAKEVGLITARKTLGASIRVKSEKGYLALSPVQGFRKSLSSKDPFSLVQVKTARLGSLGERAEIKQARRGFSLR